MEVTWLWLTMSLALIYKFIGVSHATFIFHGQYFECCQQSKVFFQVLLIWGCQWKCLAHPGGVSKVGVLFKTFQCTKHLVSSSPAEMAGLRQYSDYIIGADSVLHESEVNLCEFYPLQYNYQLLSGPVQSDRGTWGQASEALCLQHWNWPLQVSNWNIATLVNGIRLWNVNLFQLIGRWASLQMVHGVEKEVLDVESAMV